MRFQTMPSRLFSTLSESQAHEIADENHYHWRRFTPRYRAKQRLVKRIWMGAGCITLLFPTLYFLLLIFLSTTLVAFIILDETE